MSLKITLLDWYIDWLTPRVTSYQQSSKSASLERALQRKIDSPLRSWPKPSRSRQFATAEESYDFHLTLVFSLLGHLARLEGKPTPVELELAGRYAKETFRLPKIKQTMMLKTFRAAYSSGVSAEGYAKQYAKLHFRKPALLERMVGAMLYFAYCDDQYTEREEELILRVVSIFGGELSDYEELKARHQTIADQRKRLQRLQRGVKKTIESSARLERPKSAIETAYDTLGCDRSISDDELKECYRRLAYERHPDRLAGTTTDQAEIDAAREQFRELLKAYKTIQQERRTP